jgi:prevent-host-death family protein
MEITNIHEAKTHLSRLIERVAAGEEIILGKAGKPIARLVPFRQAGAHPKRKAGAWKGKVRISTDFDKPDTELEALIYGGTLEPPA